MKKCFVCSLEVNDEVEKCPECGSKIETEAKPLFDADEIVSKMTKDINPKDINSAFTFSIIGFGLVLLNLILPVVHLVGMVFAIIAITKSEKGRRAKISKATIAYVIGIISVILACIFMVLGVIAANNA